MPTLLQERLAKTIKHHLVNGIRTNKKALLKSVEYSEATAHGHAEKIMKSKGLKIALKHEGISMDNADQVVKSILNVKTVYEMVTPDNQLRAADYIAKRLGGYAPEKLEIRKVVAHITFNKPLEVKK